MTNKGDLRFCLVTIVLLVITGLSQAVTITVGRGRGSGYDFSAIQAGIDAANNGDTISVAAGEYVITEPITFRSKAITVQSEAGPDETTIRMGTPADTNRGSVVIFENNETTASILEGFTITGGSGSWDPSANAYGGGGIFFDASSGTVKDCVVVRNRAQDAGGGVLAFSGASPILIHCAVEQNTAKSGGGVMAYSESSTTLTNCIIKDNSATGVTMWVDGFGGGLHCSFSSLLILSHCSIMGNSAGISSGGVFCGTDSSVSMTCCEITSNTSQRYCGAMECAHASVILTNCLIARNTGAWNGGAVGCVWSDSSMTISNCTIWGNKGGRSAGGIGCWHGSSVTVTNSIIWANTSPVGCEIEVRDLGSTLDIAYCNVAGGRNLVSVEGGSFLNWGEGNIDSTPLFASPGYWADVNDPNIIVEPNDPNAVWIDGDYHLKSEAGRWDPFSENWIVDDVTSPCIDAGDPNSPVGDEPDPNGNRINIGGYGGTAEASMSLVGAEQIVYVQWLGHSSVKVWTDDCIVYVDPQNLNISPHDATLVCVTHTHGDHYSPSDIARVSNTQTQFIAPPDVVQRYGSGQTIAPGQTIEFEFVSVKAVPSYNTNKPNHPRSNNWVGYIIELAGKRIYVAGDTDLIEEMKSLGDINVAFLPAGGTYTMNATEAAEATEYIKPDLAIPYHWGRNVGTLRDAETFAELARSPAQIMAVDETISSDNWPEYSPLIAHWTLDEAEGDIAHDIAGGNHGTLSGEPAWQPTGGKIDGAMQFDGIDDYISTDFVLDPADGAFSVFAWIKGGAPYQVIISQVDIPAGRSIKPGSIWLCVDPLDGKLMTYCGLASAGSPIPPAPLLVSESIITDGQWHHVGFVWDGSYRSLYVDGIEAARDTAAQNPLQSATSGLRIGAGNYLEVGNFFSGLIDDVRIYNEALSPEEIEELAN